MRYSIRGHDMARILSDTEVTMCNVPCCRLVRLWCCSSCGVAVQGARRRPDRHGIATLLYNVVNGEPLKKARQPSTKNTTSPKQAFQERLWQQQLQAKFATLLGWDGYLGRGIYCWSSGGSRWVRWLQENLHDHRPDFTRHSPVLRLPKSCSARSIA